MGGLHVTPAMTALDMKRRARVVNRREACHLQARRAIARRVNVSGRAGGSQGQVRSTRTAQNSGTVGPTSLRSRDESAASRSHISRAPRNVSTATILPPRDCRLRAEANIAHEAPFHTPTSTTNGLGERISATRRSSASVRDDQRRVRVSARATFGGATHVQHQQRLHTPRSVPQPLTSRGRIGASA